MIPLAIVRQRYSPYGGAERFVEGALAALGQAGVAVSIYTRAWPASASSVATPIIVDPPYVGSLWRDWSFARAVCRALERSPPQLVQSHERLTCCDVFRAGDGLHRVWLEERAAAAPWSTRLRLAANPYHWYTRRAESRLFASPRLKAVICNSRMVRDEIVEHFGLPVDRLPVIYSAVDAAKFSPTTARADRDAHRRRLGIDAQATVFLLVGSGYERKGVAAALQALARVDGATLVVVGRESRMDRFERLARRHGVEARVRFVGPQQNPLPFYGIADVFVLPTLYDPLPNAALEAMACGLPIVTSTKSGAAELALASRCGLVCRATDIDALAEHMRTLLDPALRARLGGHAREGITALTPEAMTARLLALYRRLMARQ